MTKQNNQQKWIISAWSVLVFIILSNPFSFWLTNLILSPLGIHTATGNRPFKVCPTIFGLVLHSIVFFLIVRAMMQIKLPGIKDN